MLRRIFLIAPLSVLFAAGPSIEGDWVWRQQVAVPGDGFRTRETYFQFKSNGNTWTGTKRDGETVVPLMNLRIDGKKITFRTGPTAKVTWESALRWEGVISNGEIRGEWISDNDHAPFLLVRPNAK